MQQDCLTQSPFVAILPQNTTVFTKTTAIRFMRNLSLHNKACALLVCVALLFANTASAIVMASGGHAGMGSDSAHSMHVPSTMDVGSVASDDSHHSDHQRMPAPSDTDCMDDSSCVAECASHCTSSAISGGQRPATTSLMALYVPLVKHSPKSAVISGPYKPPKNLH